jgi:hypothetical protein
MNVDVAALLARFPKTRPPLSPKEAPVHDRLMRANRARVTLFTQISDRLESWMHRQVCRRGTVPANHDLLEIGAGTLNHVHYEPAEVRYEAIEPDREIYARRPELARIAALYGDMAEIDLTRRYRRIVSIATLEHLTELPYTLAKAGTLLEPDGILQCGIPSEGGFLWGLSWRLTVALDLYLKTGHDWTEHMRHEHINTAPEIIALIHYFFGDVRLRRFPLPLHHASLYVAITARDPDLARCRDYLASYRR